MSVTGNVKISALSRLSKVSGAEIVPCSWLNNGTYEYFHIRHNSAIATGNRVLAIAEMLPEYKSETEFCFAGAFNNDYPVDTYLEKISLEKMRNVILYYLRIRFLQNMRSYILVKTMME